MKFIIILTTLLVAVNGVHHQPQLLQKQQEQRPKLYSPDTITDKNDLIYQQKIIPSYQGRHYYSWTPSSDGYYQQNIPVTYSPVVGGHIGSGYMIPISYGHQNIDNEKYYPTASIIPLSESGSESRPKSFVEYRKPTIFVVGRSFDGADNKAVNEIIPAAAATTASSASIPALTASAHTADDSIIAGRSSQYQPPIVCNHQPPAGYQPRSFLWEMENIVVPWLQYRGLLKYSTPLNSAIQPWDGVSKYWTAIHTDDSPCGIRYVYMQDELERMFQPHLIYQQQQQQHQQQQPIRIVPGTAISHHPNQQPHYPHQQPHYPHHHQQHYPNPHHQQPIQPIHSTNVQTPIIETVPVIDTHVGSSNNRISSITNVPITGIPAGQIHYPVKSIKK